MRVAVHRSLNAILLILLVTATTTACGITGITAMAHSVKARTLTIPLPLDGKSADQIAMMSLNDLGNATSVQISGAFADSGTRTRMAVSLVKGAGCAGTVQLQGQGSVRLIVSGKVAWMKADTTFWRTQGLPASALSTLSAKYIKVTESSLVSQFSGFCGLAAQIAQTSSGATGLTKTKMIRNNLAVVELKDTASDTMVVTDAAAPELLTINAPGSGGGSFTFSNFNKHTPIVAPPAGQTLDGAAFGI